ncbi:hypothetical protein Pmani_035088 [Petrolisthes manimaculis]|uniref:Uncharacterized protein n=1 Tax=Petrolisthes manimaculis TaxID=1843537 RepID=A0AAE1NME6_9EUCA|nr:hypothetical protein Pmani_035088 [Petrolisthes manimaculis]
MGPEINPLLTDCWLNRKDGKPEINVDEKRANPVLARIQCCQGKKRLFRSHPPILPSIPNTNTPGDYTRNNYMILCTGIVGYVLGNGLMNPS